MSRARNIKPGFFKNELLVELPFEYRLLFIGLWMIADREGRFEDRPTRIRMELFPADNIDLSAGLQALHDAGFILRYTHEGRGFCQILAWHKHQNPHFREKKSDIESPESLGLCVLCKEEKPEATTGPASDTPECSPVVARLIPDSLIPDSSKEQKKPDKKSVGQTFPQFMANLPDGEAAIPEDHPVFRYAERVGIPTDFLALAWTWFERQYTGSKKRYSAWPTVFRKAVEGNWGKLWWIEPDGSYKLTTVGIQLQRATLGDERREQRA